MTEDKKQVTLEQIIEAIKDFESTACAFSHEHTRENSIQRRQTYQAVLNLIAPFVLPAASPALPQPPPQPGDGRILDLVIDDLTTRADAGKLKYGVYLQAHNGRDALVDAYQEALDLAMYLRQKLEEQRTTQEPQS